MGAPRIGAHPWKSGRLHPTFKPVYLGERSRYWSTYPSYWRGKQAKIPNHELRASLPWRKHPNAPMKLLYLCSWEEREASFITEQGLPVYQKIDHAILSFFQIFQLPKDDYMYVSLLAAGSGRRRKYLLPSLMKLLPSYNSKVLCWYSFPAAQFSSAAEAGQTPHCA